MIVLAGNNMYTIEEARTLYKGLKLLFEEESCASAISKTASTKLPFDSNSSNTINYADELKTNYPEDLTQLFFAF